MGNTNKENKGHKDFKLDTKTKVMATIIAILVVLVLVLGGISLYQLGVTKGSNQMEDGTDVSEIIADENSSEDSSEEVSVTTKDIEMTEEDKTKACTELDELLNQLRHDNTYLQAVTGSGDEDYSTYIYNKEGEIFKQEQTEFSVYRKDGKCIIFDSEYATETINTDILQVSQEAVKLAKEGIDGVSIIESKAFLGDEELTADELGYNIYVVNITNWDTVAKLYDVVDNQEFTEAMLQQIKDSYGEDWEVNLKFYFALDNVNKLNAEDGIYPSLSIACHCVYEDTEYKQWEVEGYIIVEDWELSKEWYISTLDDPDELEILVQNLSEQLKDMFKRFADKEGIDLNTIITENETNGESIETENSESETNTVNEETTEETSETVESEKTETN